MTAVAAIEAVALLVIVWLFLRHQQISEEAWTVERRELLTRIQRPEIIPGPSLPRFEFEPEEPDELELVGTILEPKEEES